LISEAKRLQHTISNLIRVVQCEDEAEFRGNFAWISQIFESLFESKQFEISTFRAATTCMHRNAFFLRTVRVVRTGVGAQYPYTSAKKRPYAWAVLMGHMHW